MQNHTLFILFVIGAITFVTVIQSEFFSISKRFRPDFGESWVLKWLKIAPNKISTFQLNHKVIQTTFAKFLSFSIDSSQVHRGFINPSLKDPVLRKIVSYVGGGYLRLGGKAADQIVFTPPHRAWPDRYLPLDGGECSFENRICSSKPSLKKFSMSALDWIQINEFAEFTGLKLLFDLNVLLRNNETWDFNNAELLLDFSFAHHYSIDWSLGNEPNSFKHVFGIEVPPRNLAVDFGILKNLLLRYPIYNSSILSGPDITNPRDLSTSPESFLRDFLQGEPEVDAISWHHYYLGPNAKIEDFLNVSTYESFRKNCRTIRAVVNNSKLSRKSIWLGETGSAYGGGVANLSDRFVSSFLWIDKLGVAAKEGISLVIRQSLYRGHYSLLDSDTLEPNPDFWISVLYKKLVGHKVLSINSSEKEEGTLRLYAHCSTKGNIIIYGLNLAKFHQGVNMALNVTGMFYSLSGFNSLLSKQVSLNGKTLDLTSEKDLPEFIPVIVSMMEPVTIPSYSIFFLELDMETSACIL